MKRLRIIGSGFGLSVTSRHARPHFSRGISLSKMATRLRLSCLTMAPRFYEKKTATSTSGLPRKPLSLVNKDGCGAAAGHLKGALSSATTTTAVSVKASSVPPLPPTPTEFSPCMRFGGRE